jgi:hypothetical protein
LCVSAVQVPESENNVYPAPTAAAAVSSTTDEANNKKKCSISPVLDEGLDCEIPQTQTGHGEDSSRRPSTTPPNTKKTQQLTVSSGTDDIPSPATDKVQSDIAVNSKEATVETETDADSAPAAADSVPATNIKKRNGKKTDADSAPAAADSGPDTNIKKRNRKKTDASGPAANIKKAKKTPKDTIAISPVLADEVVAMDDEHVAPKRITRSTTKRPPPILIKDVPSKLL